MTTIVKEASAKFAVAIVAVAMVFTMFAGSANAQEQSVEDLQALINSLMAQIAELEGGMGGDSMSSSSSVCPYTWTRDLSQGSTGADVMKLQQFLNDNPDTRVAVSGAGSAGMETEYYGPATAAAVSKMQVMYRADVLTPNGLVNATGYFGPSSRAKANSLCTAAPVDNGGDDMDDDDDMMDDDDDDNGPVTLRGEASLDNFEVDDASETDIQEGDEDVEIAEFTVEFADGDAEISRIDVSLVGSNANAEPWEAFETISLWVDGDMVAEMDADDEDEYLDEDYGTLRFSGLDIVAEEDEELDIVVGATVMDNLDDEELDDGDNDRWQVFASAIRFFDADGVATTEETQDDLAGDTPSFDDAGNAEFNVEVEGEGEELKWSTASANPDSTDIVVDENDQTDDVEIMVFELEAEEGDIELDKLVVLVETTGATTTDVIDDAYLTLDGQTFDAESISGTPGVAPAGNNSNYDNADLQGVWYVFDIDGDVTVEEDEEMDVSLTVDFKSQSGNYNNGQIVEASVTAAERGLTDAEGKDDLLPGDFSGSADGDQHTLVAEGIVVPVDSVETSESTSGDNDQTGSLKIEFEVTAVEGDFYVVDRVTAGAFNSTSTGLTYQVDGPTGFSATTSGTISSSADEDVAGVYTVREGETETFTLTVTVDTDTSGQHRVRLTGVGYTDDANGDDTNAVAYQPVPPQDFRGDYININAN